MGEKQVFPLSALSFDGCEPMWSSDQESVTLTCGPAGGRAILEGPAGAIGGRVWSSSDYLVLDVLNHQEWSMRLILAFWLESNKGKTPDMTVTIGTLPKVKTRLALPLQALDSQHVFLPRTPGRLKTGIRANKIDLTRISRFGIEILPCFARQRLEILNLYLADSEPDYPLPDEVLVDELGQYDRRDWPSKTYGVKELATYLRSEEAKSAEAAFPEAWSLYGGWKEKRFQATGFFRTEHDGERWWLVDPDGHAFYSVGLDCVQPGERAWVEGIERFFGWLPPSEGEYGPFWSEARDTGGMWHFRGRLDERARFFNYAEANLHRTFGNEWWEKWAAITRRRLMSWGLNTIGNWSQRRFTQYARLPYVWPLADFPTTQAKIFRDFPDVFSEEYRGNAKTFAQQLVEFRDDPHLIGYFLRNEPTWAFVPDINIAEEVLENPADLACKRALIRFLSERYGGDIANLNRAWKTDLSSFEALKTTIKRARRLSGAAAQDLYDFSKILIKQYVTLPSEACRRVDPQHMNLGMRYARIADPSFLEGYENFDVFSINCYRMNPAEAIDKVGELTGKPVLIGEFHFGALDRGLTSTGLRAVTSQAERGVAWRYYVENAAANVYSVGVHYFILNDQPVLGRLDGENYQIGVVDVCQRPYAEFVRGICETSGTIYQVAETRQTTCPPPPVEIERVG